MLTILHDQPALLIGIAAIAITLVYNALKDRSDRRKLDRGDAIDSRLKIYNRTMLILWSLAALCTASWLFAGHTAADLGFRNPEGWRAWASWGLTALASAYLIWSVIQVSISKKARAAVQEQIRTSGDVDMMLPQSAFEHRRFQWVSLTAGITEEIVFRGFLIGTLALAFPVWVAAIAATAIFILAHAYQGWQGMMRILPISMAFAAIFVIGGSLWPIMILHVLADASAGGVIAILQRYGDTELTESA